jgi:hypothetical protein
MSRGDVHHDAAHRQAATQPHAVAHLPISLSVCVCLSLVPNHSSYTYAQTRTTAASMSMRGYTAATVRVNVCIQKSGYVTPTSLHRLTERVSERVSD